MGTLNSELENWKNKTGMRGLPEPEHTKKRRKKRHGKSRAKMWFITRGILVRNPNATDADIQRQVREEFNESVGSDILKEARWIFKRKVESEEIVLPGKKANLNVVKELVRNLVPDDLERLKDFICRGCPLDDLPKAMKMGEQARNSNERVNIKSE